MRTSGHGQHDELAARAAKSQRLKRPTVRYMLGRSVKNKIYESLSLPLRQHLITHYFDTHAIRKLQIGTGSNVLSGWLNSDVYPETGLFQGLGKIPFLDATRPFPFSDHTIDYVFGEHVIEHMSYDQAIHLLSECYRILTPGGKIRLATPNLQVILSLLNTTNEAKQDRYCRFAVLNFLSEIDANKASKYLGAQGSLAINLIFYGHDHKFIYDRATMQATLEGVGFIDIHQAGPGESTDPLLRGLEMHGRVIGNEEANEFETMVVEGTRPG
jgi:SAM-dependent methyltransferase